MSDPSSDNGQTPRRRFLSQAPLKPLTAVASEVLEPGSNSVFDFPPPQPSVSFAYKGGPVLSAPSIKPIFWGAEWGLANPPMNPNAVLNAITRITSGSYLSSLGQYGIGGTPSIQAPMFVLDSEPPSPTPGLVQLDGAVRGLLNRLIDDDQLPEPDANWQQLNMVFLASSVANPPIPLPGTGNASAAHSSFQWQDYDLFDDDNDPVRYGWVCTVPFANVSAIDMATSSFAHELVEAMTDPDVKTGWRQNPDPGANGGEIGDVCGQLGRLDGIAVQSYWSQAQGRCVIPITDHSCRISAPDVQDHASPGEGGVENVDAFCGFAPRWEGSYVYDVTDHTQTITVQGTSSGYTDPVGSWGIAGIPVPYGAGTVTPTLDSSLPSPIGGFSQIPVTLSYVASSGTLQVTNNPADGNYEVPVTYATAERSDNFTPQISASAATASLTVEGKTVQMPGTYYVARDACTAGWAKFTNKGLQAVVDNFPKKHLGDPPRMDGQLAQIYERRFASMAEQLTAYAKQIAESADS